MYVDATLFSYSSEHGISSLHIPQAEVFYCLVNLVNFKFEDLASIFHFIIAKQYYNIMCLDLRKVTFHAQI